MAANDEYPRGWDLAIAFNPATTPSITIFTNTGISHVLTDVLLEVVNTVVSGAAFTPTVSVSPPPSGIEALGFLAMIGGSPAGTLSQFSWSGKKQFPQGTDITIAINNPLQANMFAVLEVRGYDI
jgi:hypothetical protein